LTLQKVFTIGTVMDTKYALSSEIKMQTVSLFTLSVIAVAFALVWLKPVMIPFILAVFFTLALTPIINFQIRYLRFNHVFATLTTLALGCIILAIFCLIISASITQLSANVDTYKAQIYELLQKFVDFLNSEKNGISSNITSIIDSIHEFINKELVNIFLGSINNLVYFVANGVLVIIFMTFLLFGKSNTNHMNGAWQEGESQIKKYIIRKFLISVVSGILVGSYLSLLGIDLALVFGIFVFLLNFIPTIGPSLATFLPLPVVLMNPHISTEAAVSAIVIPGVIQFVMGNIVEPKIIGRSLQLHPIVVLLALIFWGMLWGVVGMFLAVPLSSVLKIIFQSNELTQPLSHLMAGQVPVKSSTSKT
jgi:AI-2 transport protein TqsA